MRLFPHSAAGLLGALLLAAPPTFAQAVPAATPAVAAPHRDMAVEHRITQLHDRLKITAAEEQPFAAFADLMRDNARRMSSLVQARQQSANAGNAVDQMHAYADMAQAHADDMQRLVPAFAALYGALTPDQRKSADTSFREFANGPRGLRGG